MKSQASLCLSLSAYGVQGAFCVTGKGKNMPIFEKKKGGPGSY